MKPAPPITGYRFDVFELNLRSGDLSKNGRRIHLQEKPRSLLIALLERAGETVTRGELQKRLWADETFVDFEDGLNTAIRKLRETLGDDSETSQYIETIRGRGYRFIGKVESFTLKEPVATQANQSQLSRGSFWLRWQGMATAAFTLALLVAAGMFFTKSLATHRHISIAVLPIQNMTGDASREYLCTGITEELIVRLGKVGEQQLRVIAPGSARKYANTNKPLEQIGQELKVDYVIEGSLQQDGNKIRLVVQLIHVEDQSRLWTNVYDSDLSDKFEFESSVANSVAHALSLRVPTLTQVDYMPDKFEAHDAYLKGIYYLSLRSKSGFEQAIQSLSTAVAIDPKYADAYALLANTYNLMGQYGWMDAETARSLGWASAQQALSLDPTQVEAHVALGVSYWNYQWNMKQAEAEFHKALALSPTNVDAHYSYGMLLMTESHFSEAEKQMKMALDNDPRSFIIRTNLGWLNYYEGHYQQAVNQYQQVLSENPDYLIAHSKLWLAYSMMGENDLAWQQYSWIIHAVSEPEEQIKIQNAYKIGGYYAALRMSTLRNDMTDFSIPRDYAFTGDYPGALDFLERAYQTHQGWLVFVPNDPAFAPLRDDERFKQIAAITEPK